MFTLKQKMGFTTLGKCWSGKMNIYFQNFVVESIFWQPQTDNQIMQDVAFRCLIIYLPRYIVLTIALTERFFIREKMIKTRGQDHYSFWSDEAQNKLRTYGCVRLLWSKKCFGREGVLTLSHIKNKI